MIYSVTITFLTEAFRTISGTSPTGIPPLNFVLMASSTFWLPLTPGEARIPLGGKGLLPLPPSNPAPTPPPKVRALAKFLLLMSAIMEEVWPGSEEREGLREESSCWSKLGDILLDCVSGD